jgi:hypothetical protein
MPKSTSSTVLLALVSLLVGFGGSAERPSHPFDGHFVSGCSGPTTACFELWLEEDATKLRGWHAAATRNANKIEGGDYYEKGTNAPVSVHGEVHDGFATITIVSTYTGESITATLTVEGDHLRWQASDHPALPTDAVLQRK